MILEIEHKNQTVRVEITASSGTPTLTVDGKEVPYDWLRLPNGYYSLVLGGQVYDFFLELKGEECTVVGRTGSHILRVTDGRRLIPRREVEVGQAGLQRIKADMPGKVVRILVKVGEPVAYDQGLLVLEAMKMQNEIRAPKSGIVREIRVSPGTAVSAGEFLLSLE